MANSRQRRTKKRAQQHETRERLWFIAEHPLLASGALAMVVTGIGTQIAGAPMLAALFYLAAILFLVAVFYRVDLFRVNRTAAYGVLGASVVLLTVIWVKLLPPPQTGPRLLATVHQGTMFEGKLHRNNVVVLLWVTITNEGTAPSIAKEWGLIADIPQRGPVKLKPIIYTGEFEYQAGGANMRLNVSRESLIDRAGIQPISANGGMVAGILSFVIEGMKVEDLPPTGVAMSLLYKDITDKRYGVKIPPMAFTKEPPFKVPGISLGEVVVPVSPRPTPSEVQK